MSHRGLQLFALPVLALLLFAGMVAAAAAQDVGSEERSRFVRFVERQISTPNRQIRLGAIEGALSSDVRLESITIADREGVWLRIEDVHLVWSRSALLRRRLEVELLEADRIALLRAPLPAEGPSEPLEERTFELPEFPLTFQVEQVRVPRIEIAEGVVAEQAYALSLQGSGTLADGTLDVDLAVERLDGAGALQLEAAFSDETRVLDLDLLLSESPDGLVANLLNIEGRPAVSFAIQGAAPLDAFSADIRLTAGGEELLSGQAAVSRAGTGGLRLMADVGGTLERLVPPLYRELVDEGSRLTIDATRAEDGAIDIAQAELRSGVAALRISGRLASDGVPTALDLAASLAAPGEATVHLPGGDGRMTVRGARLTASLAGQEPESWTAELALEDLVTPTLNVERVAINGGGTAAAMGDPAARRVTFEVTGSASGVKANAAALADRIHLQARGAWESGAPLRVETAQIESGGTVLGFEGRVGDAMEGSFSLATPDLGLLSALAGRELGGNANISGTGSVAFADGAFSLSLDGTTQDLMFGSPALADLFQGQTTISGTVARSQAGLRFDRFVVENPQLSLQADGQQAGVPEPLTITARVDDLAAVTDRASGGLALDASISGPPDAADISARLQGQGLELQGRPFRDAQAVFTGTMPKEGLAGTLEISGAFDEVAVQGRAELARREDGSRVMRGIGLRAGETTLSGEVAFLPGGLYDGALRLDAPQLSAIAPLALLEASGALSADVALDAGQDRQAAEISAQASDLMLPDIAGGIALGAADISLSVDNLFGTPLASGQVSAEEASVAGLSFPRLKVQAESSAAGTNLDVAMALAGGELNASASLLQSDGGMVVALAALRIIGPEIEARLIDPLEVTIGDQQIEGIDAALQVGKGQLTVSGDAGGALALSGEIDAVPLELLNAFQPDLAAAGILSGTFELGGTPQQPIAVFDLAGRDLSVALFDIVGLEPIAMQAEGRFAQGSLTIDAAAEVASRTVTLSGRIGETLDASIGVDELPLEVIDAIAPELKLRGTVSALLNASGSLAAPQGTFELRGQDMTLGLLEDTGLPALQMAMGGRFQDGTAELTQAVVEIGGGRIALQGTIGETLDLKAAIEEIPLSLANTALPGTDLSGTISGSAEVTGLAFAPEATLNLTGSGIITAELTEAGVAPGELTLEGRYVEGMVTLSQGSFEIAGGRLSLDGDIWPELGLSAGFEGLPLALATAVQPALELEGSISGSARLTGSPFDPQATFGIETAGMTNSGLREAGITAATLRASGSYEAGTTTLTDATLEAGQGRIEARGTVGEALDLSAALTSFPAAAIRAVRPELDIAGTLSGMVSARGSAEEPVIEFELSGSGIRGIRAP
jgi:translocation and assembly module TamB